MERLSLRQSGVTKVALEDGMTFTVEKIERPRANATEVDFHETDHILASQEDGGIYWATDIPGPGYLGATYPKRMTAISAAAAAANGGRGTGGDMQIVRAHGMDEKTAMSMASRRLSGLEEEREEVAMVLRENGTITQRHVDTAYQDVKDRRQGIHKVEVQISYPDGKSTSVTRESFKHEVKIADLLPKDA